MTNNGAKKIKKIKRTQQTMPRNKDYMKLYSRQYLKENLIDIGKQSKRKPFKRLPHTNTRPMEKIKNDFNDECAIVEN